MLNTYFSDEHIIRELCRARLKLANKRHEALFFHEIDGTRRSAEGIAPPMWGDIPMDIFPPRKLWNRYRPKRRGRDSDLHTLLGAVNHLMVETPNADWVKRLQQTVATIRERALSEYPLVFPAPRIVPQEKDRQDFVYRPVASFPLADKIIDSLTARYLRDMLDPALLDCCLIRSHGDGRNAALDRILALRNTYPDLFVAEFDIRGFFDSVSHDIARDALRELIADARRSNPSLHIDARALEIFDAYLACYSFLRNVRQEAELELKSRHPQALYPWPEQDLRRLHGEHSTLDGIGIPQGGSLSGLIANAVLHLADKAVVGNCRDRQITYLRYCDDMILFAPDRSACADAAEYYQNVLRDLKLPIHPPEPLKPYVGSQKKSFWTAKSKPVYHWGDPHQGNFYPWIQFLGYQVRYDGAVRVRASSVNKELSKMAAFTGKVLNVLRPENVGNIRKSPMSIKRRVRMKLISMAVGRRKLGQPLDKPLPNCWTDGFRWLAGKDVIGTNLKSLDRQRERQINRISRRLRTLDLQTPDKQPTRKGQYYGYPFSYRGQFGGGQHRAEQEIETEEAEVV